jgi:hypothetical protein
MIDGCLDPQLLAAFADRQLKRSEMPPVLAHLERCPACMDALKAAMELQEEEEAPPREHPRRWWAIAAAVAILAAGGAIVQKVRDSDPAARLVRLAPRSARSVEARLSGGFAYAPYRGPNRGAEAGSAAGRMKLIGAAGELVERADAENSAATQHAAGIGLVLVERPEDAIARLRTAAEHSSADAAAWSDLAAAEYATALQQRRPSLYPIALAHADAALRLDPKRHEALFNRALILERLGLTAAAREAWERYLLADPASQWAEEARAHLARLPVSTGESLFRRDQPQFEQAATGRDQNAVNAFVARHPQQSRAWGEAEYLGRWGEAVLRGDAADASRQLAIARAIGAALVRHSGESLLRDAVAAIDRAPDSARATLADAHTAYRRGRIAYSRNAPAMAERELRAAAVQFATAGSPMAFVARYFAASARFDQNDAAIARRELETLRRQSTYAALGAQIRWELALCAILEDDWSASATLLRDAAGTFGRLGERSNLAVMQALLGTALISGGRADEGWDLRAQAFAIQSEEARANLVALSVGDAARIELRTGRREAAYALLALEEAAHRAAGDDVQLSNALVRRAVMAADIDAPAIAREAMTAAGRIGDTELRARATADARFAAGVVMRHSDSAGARELLGQAIDHYRATDKFFYLPEALLARARTSLRGGDDAAALRDLDEGIHSIDRHPAHAGGNVTGTGAVDARRELLEELIPLSLDRGDVPAAFAAAERTHGPGDTGVAALQKILAGSDAVVLELVVLPHEVIAFAVTAQDLAVSRHAVARDRVISLAARGDDEAARELYDILIRPSGATLARAGQLIVVADSALRDVAFAALEDRTTRRCLIESMTVASAVDASSLQPRQRGSATPSVLALTLPSGDGTSVALPESERELADLGAMYRSARVIGRDGASLAALANAARADVIHLGGHTQREPGAGDAALLFRGSDGGIERVTWTGVAAMHFARPVVVLAACETLRAPAAGTPSLGRGFLAAGATAAIGTLTPIPDNDARDLFRAIHRELARGRSAAAAVRQAQHEAIAAELPDHRNSWRSVAVLTTRID